MFTPKKDISIDEVASNGSSNNDDEQAINMEMSPIKETKSINSRASNVKLQMSNNASYSRNRMSFKSAALHEYNHFNSFQNDQIVDFG